MLADLHVALRRLLYEYGRIDPDEVDVRFERPTREFVDSLTRPTIDLFLFDVEENTELRQTNLRTTRENGRATHSMPPRRFDLRYLVCAPTTVVEDEHLLLWRTLATLLRHQELPADVLSDALRSANPRLTARVAGPDDGPRMLDVWTALEAPPRPALQYVVTAPVDLEIAFASPLVLTRTARYVRKPDGTSAEEGIHIGGVVRDRNGERLEGVKVAVDGSAAEGVVTNTAGQFVLPRVPKGSVRLRVQRSDDAIKLVTIDVPSDTYVIELD